MNVEMNTTLQDAFAIPLEAQIISTGSVTQHISNPEMMLTVEQIHD